MSDDYEDGLTGSRAEIAAALTGVADGVLAGRIRLGEGEGAVAVDAPDELSLEIELESEDDEVELELELEWSTSEADDPVVAPVDRGVPESADEGNAEDAGHPEGDAEDADAAVETAPPAPVGAADASESLARFEVFRDRADEWRWRLRHRNGNVIATSGEGYTRKHNAWKGLRSVMRNAPAAEVTEGGSVGRDGREQVRNRGAAGGPSDGRRWPAATRRRGRRRRPRPRPRRRSGGCVR